MKNIILSVIVFTVLLVSVTQLYLRRDITTLKVNIDKRIYPEKVIAVIVRTESGSTHLVMLDTSEPEVVSGNRKSRKAVNHVKRDNRE